MNKRSISFLSLFLLVLTVTVSAQQMPEHDRVMSEVITMDSDKLMLKQALTIDAPVAEVWTYFTQADRYAEWSAPVVEMDFRINGTIKANYKADGNIEDEDTIIIHVLNYVPEKLITLQSEIPESFPAAFRENEKDFYNIIEFKEAADGGTEIISYGLGYKDNAQFRQMIGFFAEGNLDSYEKLIDVLE